MLQVRLKRMIGSIPLWYYRLYSSRREAKEEAQDFKIQKRDMMYYDNVYASIFIFQLQHYN
jgi:hypothetical protein